MNTIGAASDPIILRCSKCKREQSYARDIDPSIPADVATIVFSRCDLCDNGDFGAELWLDAKGHEVVPAAAPGESA
jgi:hypothetical protein